MRENEYVPMLDIRAEVHELWDEYSETLLKVLASGQYINGPETKKFEQEVAAYLGVKFAVGVNSGTDALMIALRAAGVGTGDEVITTSFSFFATAESISNVGAKPVFVDIDEESYNIDAQQIEKVITKRTKAIMPVHLYGRPANMSEIMKMANNHGLKVIEDAAQSFGAKYFDENSKYDHRFTGGIGDLAAFSFYPTKNLGAFGDGGLVTTNNEKYAETALILRNHGSSRRYHNEVLGYNSRLDSMQAAILRIKLKYVDKWNEQRREAAAYYNELLTDFNSIVLPDVSRGHVFHQFSIRLVGMNRDDIQLKLAEQNIGTMIYYPIPIHKLSVYAKEYVNINLPNTERLSKEVISLPVWPGISKLQQKKVASVLKSLVKIHQ